MTTSTTIYDVLNARYMEPDKVAKSFIAPTHFDALIRPGNSIVVGARGTGKTTLLKMLKLPALREWSDEKKERIASSLNYISAFIANDRNWSSRINDFALQFESAELQRFARLALVSNQALRAINRSIAEILNGDLGPFLFLDKLQNVDMLKLEIEFSRELSRMLGEDTCVSTADIEYVLGRRIDSLVEDTNAMRLVGDPEQDVARKHRWIFADFLTPLNNAASLFNSVAGFNDLKWCLCFDELELAHPDIRNLLFGYLRGADPIFYFKLATVPFVEDMAAFQSRNAPTPQNDFTVLELWNSKRGQSYGFLRALADATIKKLKIDGADIYSVLGPSFSEAAPTGDDSGLYADGSRFFHYFFDLADVDVSFREYLQRREIGIHDFVKMSEARRAALFRKIQNIVVVRNAFFSREKGSNVKGERPIRRRRNYRGFIYSGVQNVIDICDNNPRFLLAVLDPLLAEFANTRTRVKPEVQLESIKSVANQVSGVLRAEPVHPTYASLRTVEDLKSRIGRFFRDEVHSGPFNPDPVLTFWMPSDLPDALVKAVVFAIREGAMLLEGEYTGSYLRDGLAQKRIRLSYIFAPEFLLPMMLGRDRHIEGILRLRAPKGRSDSGDTMHDLFTSAENG